jgi:hypothetical protein
MPLAAGTGRVNPKIPVLARDGDLFVVHIEGEGEDANADLMRTTGDWTAIDGSTGSVASATAGSAEDTRHSCYYAIYDSLDPPDQVVADAGDHTSACLSVYRNVDPDAPIAAVQSTTDSSADTSASITGITTTETNQRVVSAGTNGDDVNWTTWGNGGVGTTDPSELFDDLHTQGSDGSIHIAYHVVASSGVSSGTVTANISASEEEANWCFALKSLPAAAFTMAASPNITASGENTTVQLNAPSGKSTSDFDAGRIQDDENPGDTADVSADDYREDEWCITAAASVVTDDVYQFRAVVHPFERFTSYTLDPRWTIGTAGGTTHVKSGVAIEGN